MAENISIIEDYIFTISFVLIILYFTVRTIYSFYEYYHKNMGKNLFKFGHNSSFMIFWGIWVFIYFAVIEIINSKINEILLINIRNIIFIIFIIIISLFLIYFGSKKHRICENGIASFSGCWNWKEIEKYDWTYSLNSNTVKYLCITVPKSIFIFGMNKAYLRISTKEYSEHKKLIEDYLNNHNQTCT